MKTLNKQMPQQLDVNNSLDIGYETFMNALKKFTTKPYSLLVIDTTLATGNPSQFLKSN